MITKPFHQSQVIEQENEDGSIIISITVKVNFELERLLLGFGDSLEVLKPERLRQRISKRIHAANELYA